MLKRLMIVGHSNSLKELIVSILENQSLRDAYRTNQCMIYGKRTINTPNEYLECPRLYSALISLAQQASTIVFVKNVNDEYHHFPPGFSSAFPCKSLGVVLYSKDNIPSAILDSTNEFIDMGIHKDNIYTVNYECFDGLSNLSKALIGL